MKNTEMLKWMSGLDAAFLDEAEQPAIRKHSKKRLPVMIAAAAAAVCMAIGVSAFAVKARNSHMLTKYFGESGESKLTAAGLPAPVSYENGSVILTVETEIDDGINHLLLISGTDKNGTPFDWFGPNTLFVIREDGTYYPLGHSGSGFGWKDDCVTPEDYRSDYPKYWSFVISSEELAKADQPLYLKFDSYSDIRIPIGTEKNTGSVDFTDGSGTVYSLSCFELVYTGKEEKGLSHEIYLIGADGSRKLLKTGMAAGSYLTDPETMKQSDTYRIFFSVSDSFVETDTVAAVEVDGTVYTRAG